MKRRIGEKATTGSKGASTNRANPTSPKLKFTGNREGNLRSSQPPENSCQYTHLISEIDVLERQIKLHLFHLPDCGLEIIPILAGYSYFIPLDY